MKNKKKGLIKQVTRFKMHKSGKFWVVSSLTQFSWLNLPKKSARQVKVELQETQYQRVYGDSEDEEGPQSGRALRLITGLASGVGLGLLGHGLMPHTVSAETTQAGKEKALGTETLAQQESVAIPLTNSIKKQSDLIGPREDELINIYGNEFSQRFVTNADASIFGDTVTLTPDEKTKKGNAILDTKIDMREDFYLKGFVNLGTKTQAMSGGDGVAFVLQPGDTSQIGDHGNAMGMGGLKDAVGFKLDTYWNENTEGNAGPDPVNMRNKPFGAFISTTDTDIIARTDMDSAQEILIPYQNRLDPIELFYDSKTSTLNFTYRETSFSKDISYYTNKYRNMSFAINASTGDAYNLQQFKLEQFSYTLGKGLVKKQFVDTEGNPIALEETLEGRVGETWEVDEKPQDIPGYIFVEVKGPTKGTFTVNDQNVTYVYRLPSVSESESENDSLSESDSRSQSESISNSESISVSTSDSEFISESESKSESVSDSESVSESVSKSASIFESDSKTQSASNSNSESLSDSELISMSESKSESISISASESISKSQSESESTSESLSSLSSNSESESVSQSQSESISGSESLSGSESVSSSETNSESASISESESVSQSQSESISSSGTNSESVSISESESVSQSQSESISSSETNSESVSISESESVSQSQSASISGSESLSGSESVSFSETNSESSSISESESVSQSQSASISGSESLSGSESVSSSETNSESVSISESES
ncbi:lectin-like domain-containing protein, partial [Lactococcus garvieae]|uniref:lectin-like domain-containing protein n=2 Tax=Lactococcus garvieae TaxID=1363 RepID=UPI00254DB5BA